MLGEKRGNSIKLYVFFLRGEFDAHSASQLKAISNLKAKRGRGESLDIGQQDKIKKEEQIRRELESLSI